MASRERKLRVEENSDKQVLMDFQRQANYRERQRKLSSKKELKKKAWKAQKDRLRYVGKCLEKKALNVKELKMEQKKAPKKKKLALNIKIQKIKNEIDLLKVEQLALRKKISK